MENNEKSFEELISDFENVIRNLENKNISLDDAVKNYTLGIELSKKCYDILDKNEKLVTLKMAENGLENFDSKGD